MSARTSRHSLLRYTADWRPLSVVLASFGLHLAVFFWAPPWLALALLPFVVGVSTVVAAFNHHHQHVNVFHSRWLNRAYDVVLAVQSGVGPYTWVLHHNLGHHRNYLNQPPCAEPDESHWTRADGSQMGRLEYTLHTFFHHQVDVYRVGRRHPQILRRYLLMKIPCYAFIAAGFYLNPLNYLLAFFIPSLLTLMHTCYATYEHHAGHSASDHVKASVNREHSLFNWLTCNLGLHTAHHMKPGLHWSKLPELHASIRSQIPEQQLLSKFW
ncbi:MAG: fatty acid desaturase [Polyangiaceae bacterium]